MQSAVRVELISRSIGDGRRALAARDKVRTFRRGSYEAASFDPLWLRYEGPGEDPPELLTPNLEALDFDLRVTLAALPPE